MPRYHSSHLTIGKKAIKHKIKQNVELFLSSKYHKLTEDTTSQGWVVFQLMGTVILQDTCTIHIYPFDIEGSTRVETWVKPGSDQDRFPCAPGSLTH